jgi:hypothetical protein
LGETLSVAKGKITSFKRDPQFNSRRKLQPMDELIVPDVLFRLTHHFRELEQKFLANPEWAKLGYFIFEARQIVDFSLSRTGVTLKSEGRVGAGAGLPRQLCFDKPFLIYVKKRGDDYSPFFVMWVDNAELMTKPENTN